MKKIDISTKKHPNTFTLVDDCDYAELSKYKWSLTGHDSEKPYVSRSVRIDGKRRTILMHIEIMGKVEGKETDHKSGDTLDNQRHNLRHCTAQENSRNRGINITNTSGYKGVSWTAWINKWRSRIDIGKKTIHLGYFACPIEAAEAYDRAARKHFGEFAKCNFE